MSSLSLTAPAPIAAGHESESFDCGEVSLNDWLKKRALKNEGRASRSYVVCSANQVVGYYCLAAGAIGHAEAPKAMRRNMPDPIPVLVLGRLAIDKNYQGRGIGKALLNDAVQRALRVADSAGVTALLVHALSDDAKRFYASCGFVESPIHPMTLCLPLETVRRAVE